MFTRSLKSSSLLIQRAFATKIPGPSKEIPDVTTFLTKIGRDVKEHEEHFPTWNSLFTTSGRELKEKGIDVHTRRYILRQVEHLRQGDRIKQDKLGKKSYYGGERKRAERVAKLNVEKRLERYSIEDAENSKN